MKSLSKLLLVVVLGAITLGFSQKEVLPDLSKNEGIGVSISDLDEVSLSDYVFVESMQGVVDLNKNIVSNFNLYRTSIDESIPISNIVDFNQKLLFKNQDTKSSDYDTSFTILKNASPPGYVPL